MDNLLRISHLKVSVEDKEILKGIQLNINRGEIHAIMGPNGSGKSTLAHVLMGHPKYDITQGQIMFKEQEITRLDTHKRARLGLFLSFQYPEEVPGITVEKFLRTAQTSITGRPVKLMAFKKLLRERMEQLNIAPEYAQRYLNDGFSGGEKKKNEILQMMVLQPELAILDETDSGLDIEAVKTVSQGIRMYSNEKNALLIITHHREIFKYIQPDYVHILLDGQIVRSSDASLMDEIESKGYQWLKENVREAII